VFSFLVVSIILDVAMLIYYFKDQTVDSLLPEISAPRMRKQNRPL